MKKIVLNILGISLFSLFLFFSFSCKRCYTCTYNDTRTGVDTSKFCGNGNTFKNQLDQHEKNGWNCTED